MPFCACTLSYKVRYAMMLEVWMLFFWIIKVTQVRDEK